jgi:hypothetical protein
MASIEIPSGVASLGSNSFQNCTNMTGIYFHGDAPTVGADAFSGDTLATAYFIEGKSGWPTPPTAWNGIPTAYWT